MYVQRLSMCLMKRHGLGDLGEELNPWTAILGKKVINMKKVILRMYLRT